MSLESFSRFGSFPVEIKRLVWDAAVRPIRGKRQVQFFTIFDHYYNTANPRYPVHGDFLRLGDEGRSSSCFKLAVPHHDDLDGRNNSTYLQDSGLWMACRESRAAMERHYTSNEWWSVPSLPDGLSREAKPGHYREHSDASHTASYVNRDGNIRHITFRPADDLIYLAPLKLDQVDWFHHYAGDSVPLVDGDRCSSLGRSFFGPNIAMDYEPMLMTMLKGRVRDQCLHTWSGESEMSLIDMVDVFHENTGRTLWFTDFRLKRRQRSRSEASQRERDLLADNLERKERVVFYSDNCIFSEVKKCDMADWTIEQDEDGNRETVFDMFDLLFQKANGRLEIENSDRMRVLACEAQPGKSVKPWKPARNAPCEACTSLRQTQKPVQRNRNISTTSDDDDDINLEGFSLFD